MITSVSGMSMNVTTIHITIVSFTSDCDAFLGILPSKDF